MSNKTGRTQTRIVQAVCAMLMGKTVLHVSGTSGAAKAAMSYARIWLHDNGWRAQNTAPMSEDIQTLTLRFGIGELKFACMETARGLRYTTVMHDHFVEECIEATVQKQARTDAKIQIAKLMDQFGWECIQPSRQFTDGRREFWLNGETKDEG